MPKKLNLTLREPVRLHETGSEIPKLSKSFENKKKKESSRQKEKKEIENFLPASGENEQKMQKDPVKNIIAKTENRAKGAGRQASVTEKNDLPEVLEKMPPRVRQIWSYFCEAAKKDGDLQNSFTITRAEVMKKAGIGSTNTYRDALRKFQDAELIEIELRPGVNTGSVFHLTEKGLVLAKQTGE
jgi:hypothetical protein